jgi:hypothetical protein
MVQEELGWFIYWQGKGNWSSWCWWWLWSGYAQEQGERAFFAFLHWSFQGLETDDDDHDQLVTIYDLKITTIWEGQLSDGTTVRGLLTAVEVSHDMEESEYQFENTFEDPAAFNSNSEAQALKQEASKTLADKMRPLFQQMPKDMIAAHGKDLLAQAENDSQNASSAGNSGASTPAISAQSQAQAPAAAAASTSTSKPAAKKSNAKVSTTRVTKQEDFMIVSDKGYTGAQEYYILTGSGCYILTGRIRSLWSSHEWPEGPIMVSQQGDNQARRGCRGLSIRCVPLLTTYTFSLR